MNGRSLHRFLIRPGLVTLRCDIHEHMRGLILVLEYAIFCDDGYRWTVSIDGASFGPLTLKAWIDSKTTREQPVELKNGETLHVDFR